MIFPICNNKPERAPQFKGHSFILCWRCTGLVVGVLVSCILLTIITPLGLWIYLSLIPMGIDGVAQYYFGYMSNNVRRFITGFIGGLTALSGH